MVALTRTCGFTKLIGEINEFFKAMTDERYKQLFDDCSLALAPAEIAEGWHFCHEFDGLLVGPGMHELWPCRCWPSDHPVYKTRPSCPFCGEQPCNCACEPKEASL